MKPRPGWRQNGPGRLSCLRCGRTVSTNALARAAHERACRTFGEARTSAASNPLAAFSPCQSCGRLFRPGAGGGVLCPNCTEVSP